MKSKVSTAVEMLRATGHRVEAQIRGASGTMWYQIDGYMLASHEEMENLADGVYTLTELQELYEKRRADEKSW
jgi:hypothetical protein